MVAVVLLLYCFRKLKTTGNNRYVCVPIKHFSNFEYILCVYAAFFLRDDLVPMLMCILNRCDVESKNLGFLRDVFVEF